MLSDNKYSIKQTLAEKFKGIIWKIEVDDAKPLIAIEARDVENHTASFSLFNYEDGSVLFRDVSVDDSWARSLGRVSNGIVYLNILLSKESPQYKGIIALNSDGGVLWQSFNKTFHDISGDGLIVFDPKVQPVWFDVLNARDGSTIQSRIQNWISLKREVVLPEYLSSDDKLPVNFENIIVSEIAFLHYNNKDIYCYHLKNGNSYTQQLLINEGDTILLKEDLAQGILKLNPEAFFITRSNLFCIRDEKREIVSYLV